MQLEGAIYQWREGERGLRSCPPERRVTYERVVEAVVAELRRRLGGRFTVAELAELYMRGTSWCLQMAFELAPRDPWAWDSAIAADAAFFRYVREAADFAGGRHIAAEG